MGKPKLFKRHGVWFCMSEELTTVGDTMCQAWKAWQWGKNCGFRDSLYG
jgi:hypothetical protein